MNRTPQRGQQLARTAKARYLKRADVKKMRFDLIINATPVGMTKPESPLNADEINARYVFEMIYYPPETKLVKLARERGAQIISGVEMFVHQGARQFEIWTGKPAPLLEMHSVVQAALMSRIERPSVAATKSVNGNAARLPAAPAKASKTGGDPTAKKKPKKARASR
jgi:3-dehydroquinate dehydratase/shikimate dehydrogenase